jgi:tRNA (mo5U34)-methyltransferase
MATAVMDDELRSINWFHQIDLGGGVTTPGIDDTATKLAQVHLPADLTGQSVLDIGAWDGFFSFECEKRGASRIVALDGGVWKVGHIGKKGFEYARRSLASSVEDVEMEVMDITPERLGVFDLVLFLGVLYHLPHPVLGIKRVAAVTGKQMILETHVDLLDHDRPAVAYYPWDQCANDPSNWCGPNPAAVKGMLRLAGFRRIETFGPTPVAYDVVGARRGTFGRMVFHAWK